MPTEGIRRKKKILHKHTVIKKEEIGHNVFIIETNRIFDFLPGQIVAVALRADGDQPRLYSIASGTNENCFRILFDINPKGVLTPSLAELNSGDELYISEPFGRFLGTEEPAFWIATGTGIAPFISMCLSGLHENKTLLHGSRRLINFFYQNLFKEKMGDRYLRFCTGEKSPEVIEGRLTNYLKDESNLSDSIKYYLCGSAEMIIEVRDILIEQKGIPLENIISEIYF